MSARKKPPEPLSHNAREVNAAQWVQKHPEAAAKALARALLTCTMPVTSDWLLGLCKAEGFK